jgi:hypothetical protein
VVNFRESAFNLIINEIAYGIVQIPLVGPSEPHKTAGTAIERTLERG